MPGWRVHEFIDRIFFGKSYHKIHRKMDEPVIYLGRAHRVLFHDPLSAYAIAKSCYPDDPNAVMAAQYHILYDELCSSNPEYKRALENMELLSRKKRRKGTKRAPKKEDPILAQLKKMEEIKRLFRLLYSS